MTIAQVLIKIAKLNDEINDMRVDPIRFADDLDEALDFRKDAIRKLNRLARKLSANPKFEFNSDKLKKTEFKK